MARKRKNKRTFKIGIKYELYGILILTLSVIALSREGAVGRALFYMFGYLLGQTWLGIPILAIYIGLFVMMKRQWPREWSFRKTGLVLLYVAFLIVSHFSMFAKIDPFDEFHMPSTIIRHTWDSIRADIAAVKQVPELPEDIGGGLAGAVLYALLFYLFGDGGSRLLAYMLIAIGVILVTGLSIVDAFARFQQALSGARKGMAHRWRDFVQRKRPVKPKKVEAKQPVILPDDDDLEEDELIVGNHPAKRKPVFFQLFQPPGKPEAPDSSDYAEVEPDEFDAEGVLITQPDEEKQPVHTDEMSETEHPDMMEMESLDEADESDESEESMPVVRDFQERREDSTDYGIESASEWLREQSGDTEDDTIMEAESVATMGEDAADGEAAEEAGTESSLPAKPDKPYFLPPLSLLSRPPGGGGSGDTTDYKANARKLEATLESFGVRAKVLEVVRGPAVTRYEIQPDTGVKVSRIVSLTDDIALALAAKDVRMEAPIPGKSAIGIEVPNPEVSIVTLREVMETSLFQDSPSKLTIALGRDVAGKPIIANLAKMPHLLVAGATGSGKSVCINGIITSILYKAKPDEVKLMLIDPKMVELTVYNGIPHLLAPVVTDPRRASMALKKVVQEMEHRYELFAKTGTRNIEGYNALVADPESGHAGEPLPYIVVIVDELADLMMVASADVEDSITRLAQMARAAGIHLIIATQRPSVDVITGVIKANIPSRIAFGVSSQVDSRTILDMAGAEKLLGRGDMLFLPVGMSKPIRVQGAFLSDQEVEAVVKYVSGQGQAEYDERLIPTVEDEQQANEEPLDELYGQAVQIVVESKHASVSLLQRRLRIGYTRAARLIDEMEARGIIGPYEGSKPREVLISQEQYDAQIKTGS